MSRLKNFQAKEDIVVSRPKIMENNPENAQSAVLTPMSMENTALVGARRCIITSAKVSATRRIRCKLLQKVKYESHTNTIVGLHSDNLSCLTQLFVIVPWYTFIKLITWRSGDGVGHINHPPMPT